MGGIGLALVLARGRLERVDARSPLGRVGARRAARRRRVLVSASGSYLTFQAVAGSADALTVRRAATSPSAAAADRTRARALC